MIMIILIEYLFLETAPTLWKKLKTVRSKVNPKNTSEYDDFQKVKDAYIKVKFIN